MNEFKTPPHSIEAEQAVVGGMMLQNYRVDTVIEILGADDFWSADNRKIAEAIFVLYAQNQPCDLVTVGEYLERNNSQVDYTYLSKLAKDTPSAANIKSYAEVVREKALSRESIAELTNALDDIYNQADPVNEVLDKVQTKLMMLTNRTEKTGAQHVKAGLSKALDEIDAAFNSDGQLTGLSTGMDIVDRYTNGLQKQDLIIVGGRPSMGKTTLVLNWAEHAAATGKSVIFFSMEMSASQLGKRSISSLGKVELEKLNSGKNIHDEDWRSMTSALSVLNASKLYIDETPALKLAQIRARCRKQKRQHGLDLVVIDYMQLMEFPKGNDNLSARVGEISKGLKQLAKEMDCPVVCLSQLNRGVESRGVNDRRPRMSDLRESGSIEQDADMIFFVYRDEVYNKDQPFNKNIAELGLEKNRQGKTGTLYLNCFLNRMKFSNYTGDMPPAYTQETIRPLKRGGLN